MEVAVAVNSFVTARAKAEVFKSAGAIVEKVISTEIDLMARLLGVRILYIFCPCCKPSLPESRPMKPRDLDFVLDQGFILD